MQENEGSSYLVLQTGFMSEHTTAIKLSSEFIVSVFKLKMLSEINCTQNCTDRMKPGKWNEI